MTENDPSSYGSEMWWLWCALVAMADEVGLAPDVARIERTVQVLSGASPMDDGQSLSSRHVLHPDHDVAAAWLRSELEDLGLDVRCEAVSAVGRDDLCNLVADLPGAQPGLPWIIVGAHLDTTGQAVAGWDAATDPAPGADDDASGCAAVLELARLLIQRRLRHPVRFVLFDAEELGLVGSTVHADALAEAGESVRLMLSLDPVGHNPGGAGVLWVTYDARWPADALALEALGQASSIDALPIDAALIGGDLRSDQAPFWLAGMPALHLASFPQPPEYHTPDDDMAVVDVQFLSEVTRIAGELVVAVAQDLPPRAEGSTGCSTAWSAQESLGLWWARRRSP